MRERETSWLRPNSAYRDSGFENATNADHKVNRVVTSNESNQSIIHSFVVLPIQWQTLEMKKSRLLANSQRSH